MCARQLNGCFDNEHIHLVWILLINRLCLQRQASASEITNRHILEPETRMQNISRLYDDRNNGLQIIYRKIIIIIAKHLKYINICVNKITTITKGSKRSKIQRQWIDLGVVNSNRSCASLCQNYLSSKSDYKKKQIMVSRYCRVSSANRSRSSIKTINNKFNCEICL